MYNSEKERTAGLYLIWNGLWCGDASIHGIRPLFEQKASSQLDLDNAVAAYESAKADVQVSEARTKENLSVVNLYKALGGWKDF